MSTLATEKVADVTEHVVRSLVLYALAEFQSGNARALRVSAEGTSFSISDDGRGHAIDRTVDGLPYLPFIYTHLEYPFLGLEGGSVQLHGIGMSLLNALCSELSVAVHKRTETLYLSYKAGHLHEELRVARSNEETGNTISGKVKAQIQSTGTSVGDIEHWLLGVLSANPGLRLYFNGKELHASPASAA